MSGPGQHSLHYCTSQQQLQQPKLKLIQPIGPPMYQFSWLMSFKVRSPDVPVFMVPVFMVDVFQKFGRVALLIPANNLPSESRKQQPTPRCRESFFQAPSTLTLMVKRSGKSCRMRWVNYLRPGIKRGNISADEEDLIVRLHKLLGNRWSLIAGRIPGRTDNEIKNYWNTHLSRRSSSDQELLEHHKPSINPKNQHNKKGLIPSDQSHKAKAIRPKHFKCTKVDVGIPSHLQDDQDHQIMVDTTNNINAFSSSSVPAGSSSNDLFILDLLNSTEIQQAQMKEWQVAMVENYWRGSPIIAAVDPFEPNIDGEVAFNALSSFMNIEDYQYWIN